MGKFIATLAVIILVFIAYRALTGGGGSDGLGGGCKERPLAQVRGLSLHHAIQLSRRFGDYRLSRKKPVGPGQQLPQVL